MKDEIQKIIHEFGRVVEDSSKRMFTHYPSNKFPQSLLPYKKEEIKEAFDSALKIRKLENDSKEVEILELGLYLLDNFVDDEEAYIENHKILGESGYWQSRKDIGKL